MSASALCTLWIIFFEGIFYFIFLSLMVDEKLKDVYF